VNITMKITGMTLDSTSTWGSRTVNRRLGPTRTVVFVCEHGAAKSVLAAALLERLAAEHGISLRVLARGTEPQPQVAPAVVAGLLAQRIDVRAWRPQPLTPGDLAQAWRVVSFGPDLSNLVPNGTLVQVWDDVPAVADGFQAAQAAIAGRLPRLIKDDAHPRRV
jgi:protein-tyrosine-phosphatase